MFKVITLSEKTSDSFLCRIGSKEEQINILIDGGLKSDAKKSLCYFKKMKENYGKIDAVILTHVDNDHLNGLISLFESDVFDNTFVQKVLLNCPPIKMKGHLIENSDEVGYKEGNKFLSIIETKKIRTQFASKGDIIQFDNNVSIKVIAPDVQALKTYNNEWDQQDSNEVSGFNDHDMTFEELMSEKFKEDESSKNIASIAFIIQYKDKKALFTGDSVPSQLIKEDQLPESVDIFKLPHHGSAFNINEELLKSYPSSTFIIPASVGTKPHKKTIAILSADQKPKNIYLPKNNWLFDEEIKMNHLKLDVLPYVIGTEINI